MIHLSQEEYIELLRAQEKLKCLEVVGNIHENSELLEEK